jgi:hypothetical protein
LPSAGEHGVNGYTNSPVGGFGESYAAQVAHGGESESPGTPSDSELDAEAQPSTGEALGHAVLKSLGRAHIDAADLRVEATGTQVRLHGTVRQSSEKTELEARARAVPGVSSVVNELKVLRGDWDNG